MTPNDSSPEGRALPLPGSRLHVVYFLLAAFDVLAVSLSLYLTNRITAIYVDSVAVNQVWASRQNDYLELGSLATAVNAPGNDVFDSGAVPLESNRLETARIAFERRLSELEDDLRMKVRPEEAAPLLTDFANIRTSMQEMCTEAHRIFSYFETGHPQAAGERMATMDRKFAAVHRSLETLSRDLADQQRMLFAQQTAVAGRLSRYEYPIAFSILVMVWSAIYYGRKIERQMAAVSAAREHCLRQLEVAARELTEAKEKAEAANKAKAHSSPI